MEMLPHKLAPVDAYDHMMCSYWCTVHSRRPITSGSRTSYSLGHMLGNDGNFIGGTFFQVMCDYHRWRNPIDGVVKKTRLIPGT